MQLKLLFILLFSITTADAYIISSHHLNRAKSNPRLAELWKQKYLNNVRSLTGMSAETLLNRINSTNSLTRLYNEMNRLYQNRYNALKRSSHPVAHEAYFATFISSSKDTAGISQLVYETALACRLFRQDRSFHDKACRAYPKLVAVALDLALDKLPGRGKTYGSRYSLSSSQVNPNRGLVLLRAFIPLFLARQLVDNDSRRYWSLSLRRKFGSELTKFEREINESLRDVFVEKISKYPLASDTNSSLLSWALRNYSPSRLVSKCIERRNRLNRAPVRYRKQGYLGNQNIEKCTNNHIIAGFLGRLMIQIAKGASYRTIDGTYADFKNLINVGIYKKHNEYVMSDIYRSHNVVSGKTEKKGITYSLLQQRFLILAAEIFIKRRNKNLYEESGRKLIQSINFMSKILNASHANSTHVTFFRKFFHGDEYRKYVNQGSSYRNRAWGRNYGMMSIPHARYCSRRNNYNFLCLSPNSRDSKRIKYLGNTIPTSSPSSYAGSLVDMFLGPIQLLYN